MHITNSLPHKIRKFIAACVCIVSANAAVAKTDALIVDQYMSPFMGSALNLSMFHTYTFLDDKYLPSSAGKINVFWSLGRIIKLSWEDIFAQWQMVFQHEVFGHGYRLREYGFSDISYFVGIGHGWTAFDPIEFAALPFTKRAALSAAGMEANAVLSEQIRRNWIVDNQIDRRDAWLYWVTSLDQADYILGTTDSDSHLGNDVNSYVLEVNDWYGNTNLTKHKLRHYAYFDLLDPSLYMGLYEIGDYLLQGTPHMQIYMLNYKCYRYIFAPRLLLAPFGPEFQIQNYVLTPKKMLIQINVRYGNNSDIQSYGLDVFIDPIWQYKNWTFGNKLYLWRQPKFLKQNTAVGVKNGLGFGEFIAANYKLYKCLHAVGEFGYKTAGYAQGIPLGNSWVWRAGFSLKY